MLAFYNLIIFKEVVCQYVNVITGKECEMGNPKSIICQWICLFIFFAFLNYFYELFLVKSFTASHLTHSAMFLASQQQAFIKIIGYHM